MKKLCKKNLRYIIGRKYVLCCIKKKACIKRGSDLTLCIENVARLSDRYYDRSRIGFFLTDWTKHQDRIKKYKYELLKCTIYLGP